MLMIGLFNLLLAVVVVTGLVAVCLVPRLFRPETRLPSSEHQPVTRPDRLAA
jgi:hypothetical protein